MKVHIYLQFHSGPFGGGNQFLKALRQQLMNRGAYAETVEESSIILFNNFQNLGQAIKLKRKFPEKIFIHRIDGPIHVYRQKDTIIDSNIYRCNSAVADGTVFQSAWSRDMNYASGMKKNNFEAVIMNAPDPTIFNQSGRKNSRLGRKTRLVATSWSANPRKGFDVYKYLDKHLDFGRYEMKFIGSSPIRFANISIIAPIPSIQLANELKNSDIFIGASHMEACSNALIEAMHCGCVPVARNNSSQPEIVGSSGVIYNGLDDVIEKINIASEHLDLYRMKLRLPTINTIVGQYHDFFTGIHSAVRQHTYQPKQVRLPVSLWLSILLLQQKLQLKLMR